jgi:hypothetical protein
VSHSNLEIFQDILFFYRPDKSSHDLTCSLVGLNDCDKFRSEWPSSKRRFLNARYPQPEEGVLIIESHIRIFSTLLTEYLLISEKSLVLQ